MAPGYSGKPKTLKDMFVKAITHKGFSVLHIFSPCVSMNKQITFKTMNEIVKPLPDDWDTSNRLKGMEAAMDTSTFWTGIVYEDQRPTIHQRLDELEERSGHYDDLGGLFKKFK